MRKIIFAVLFFALMFNANFVQADTVPPELVHFIGETGEWMNTPIPVYVEYSEPGTIYWCYTPGKSACIPSVLPNNGGTTEGTSIVITDDTEGAYNLCVQSEDSAGNLSELVCKGSFMLDVTEPDLLWMKIQGKLLAGCRDQPSDCSEDIRLFVSEDELTECPIDLTLYTEVNGYVPETDPVWGCAYATDLAGNQTFSEPMQNGCVGCTDTTMPLVTSFSISDKVLIGLEDLESGIRTVSWCFDDRPCTPEDSLELWGVRVTEVEIETPVEFLSFCFEVTNMNEISTDRVCYGPMLQYARSGPIARY